MKSLTKVVTCSKKPWLNEQKECVCGARFPHPSTTKDERRAWSFHLNDCKEYQQAREQRQQQEAEAVQDWYYVREFGDSHPRKQLQRNSKTGETRVVCCNS